MAKLLLLDVDGTLVPFGAKRPSQATAQAIRKLQAAGVVVAVATGRTAFALQDGILGDVKPDYVVAANGAQLLDGEGKVLHAETFTPEEMYALVDFCEDYEESLAFCYEDGYYAYLGYEELRDFYSRYANHPEHIKDGEDQDRHLQSMPVGAFCRMTEEHLALFEQKFGYLGLRFVPYAPNRYDIMRGGMDKVKGAQQLGQRLNIAPSQMVAIGDNHNDVALLQFAGTGVCVANGHPVALQAADRVCPASHEEGVAHAIHQLFGV